MPLFGRGFLFSPLGLACGQVGKLCPNNHHSHRTGSKMTKEARRGNRQAPKKTSASSVYPQCITEATVTDCNLVPAEHYFSLVAKHSLDKRDKAGYSVSNCCLHNFFLIAFSIDNLCQNEHSTDDAGKTVCQILTLLLYRPCSGLYFRSKKFLRHSI
jgi:hypothetical protein